VTVALIVPSGAQASVNSCVAIGGGSCTAIVAGSHPDVGVVATGRTSRGVFRIACTQGSHAFVREGFVPLNGTKIIPIPLNGDCVLRIRSGRASLGRREAAAMCNLHVVVAPDPRPEDAELTVFLAGGITGCPDWQSRVIALTKTGLGRSS
jgi:hypothetical protein